MADDVSRDNGSGTVPPKLDLRKSGAIRPAAPAGVGGGMPSPTPPPASKKETSKIPLQAARPTPPDALREAPTRPVVIPVKPSGPTLPAPSLEADTSLASKKRTTSRISLESVLGDQATGAVVTPKTIKLKRPDDISSPRVTADLNALRTEMPDTDQDEVSTMKVTREPKPEAASESSTRKKTFVLKRGEVSRETKPLAVARSSEGMIPGAPQVIKKPDIMHWGFLVSMCIAMILVMVTMYVFAAQIVGPNISLTEHSYNKQWSPLKWPGKIMPAR